jgi:hypothetical protein
LIYSVFIQGKGQIFIVRSYLLLVFLCIQQWIFYHRSHHTQHLPMRQNKSARTKAVESRRINPLVPARFSMKLTCTYRSYSIMRMAKGQGSYALLSLVTDIFARDCVYAQAGEWHIFWCTQAYIRTASAFIQGRGNMLYEELQQ